MIKRELYLNKIRPYFNKNIIKAITGIRRSGKSTILKQIIEELKNDGIKEENIILINFELKKHFNIKNIYQLDDLITSKIKNQSGKIYLFFDEIQEIENWEKLINSYLAEEKYDIFITGSNSKLLSGELATYLTGRFVEIKIYPFSFLEFLEYKKSKKEELFTEYLKYGGMPSGLEYDKNERTQYLTDLYNSIIYNDILKRYEIRDIDLLDRIVRFIIGNIGQIVSGNSIVKYLKKDKVNVSVNTIYNYLSYIEEACLIHKVKREDLIGKKILNHSEKFYLVDLGFREAIYGNNLKDIGQVLENIVYLELLRRGYKITIGTFRDYEIDFVCKKSEITIYIQVAYVLADEKTIKREFDSLLKIKDNYPKYVITTDSFDMSQKGIKHLNIIDFLKEKEI